MRKKPKLYAKVTDVEHIKNIEHGADWQSTRIDLYFVNCRHNTTVTDFDIDSLGEVLSAGDGEQAKSGWIDYDGHVNIHVGYKIPMLPNKRKERS